MTGRERYLRTARFEKTDRIPNIELAAWPQTLERWRQEGLPFDVQRGWFAGEPLLGLDPFLVSAGIDILPIPRYESEIIEETDRYIISRNASHGYITKALKTGAIGSARLSMDTYLEFPVKDRESFLAHKERFDPRSPERYPANLEKAPTANWKWRDCVLCPFPRGSSGPSGFYSLLRQWLGTENTSYAFYDQPDLLHEILDFWSDFLLAVLERVIDRIQFDVFHFFEDFAGKSGPLFSPATFDEFFAPHYRKIISYVKDKGIDVVTFDSDGNIDVLIPRLIECGITVILPLEIAAGTDPAALRKEYGERIVLQGGIDKRALIHGKEAIDKELEERISDLVRQGGYIPHLDHAVPPDVSLENFLYYLDKKKSYLG